MSDRLLTNEINWSYRIKPDIGPIDDESLWAYLSRAQMWANLLGFVELFEGEGDNDNA